MRWTDHPEFVIDCRLEEAKRTTKDAQTPRLRVVQESRSFRMTSFSGSDSIWSKTDRTAVATGNH